MTEWQVIVLPVAELQLAAIKDRRILEKIGKRTESLQHNPDE